MTISFQFLSFLSPSLICFLLFVSHSYPFFSLFNLDVYLGLQTLALLVIDVKNANV